MNLYLRLSFFLGFALAIQSCASDFKRIGLSDKNQQAIKEVELYNLVIQEEILPLVEMSDLGVVLGGGLIPALIDASRNFHSTQNAVKTMSPLYAALDSYDYRKISSEVFNKELATMFHLVKQNVPASGELLSNLKLYKSIKTKGRNEAFLYLRSYYRLSSDFKRLLTTTQVTLYLNSTPDVEFETPMKEFNSMFIKHKMVPDKSYKEIDIPVYDNVITFLSASVGEGNADSVALWAADNARLLKERLKQSVEQISSLALYDIAPHPGDQCGKSVRVKFDMGSDEFYFAGNLSANRDDYFIVRDEDGKLLISSQEPKFYKYGKIDKSCKKRAKR